MSEGRVRQGLCPVKKSGLSTHRFTVQIQHASANRVPGELRLHPISPTQPHVAHWHDADVTNGIRQAVGIVLHPQPAFSILQAAPGSSLAGDHGHSVSKSLSDHNAKTFAMGG